MILLINFFKSFFSKKSNKPPIILFGFDIFSQLNAIKPQLYVNAEGKLFYFDGEFNNPVIAICEWDQQLKNFLKIDPGTIVLDVVINFNIPANENES